MATYSIKYIIIIAAIGFVHLLGLIWLLLNSARSTESLKRGRWISYQKSFTVVTLYHVVLLYLELGYSLLFQLEVIDEIGDKDFNLITVIWIGAAGNYAFILLFLLISCIQGWKGCREDSWIGDITAGSLLTAVNSFLLCCALQLGISGLRDDRGEKHLLREDGYYPSEDDREFAERVAIGLACVAYVSTLVETGLMLYYVKLAPDGILSKGEAVSEISTKTEEQPYVEWKIQCGNQHTAVNFKPIHSDTRVYSFLNTVNWETETPSGTPSIRMFARANTQLRMRVTSSAGDDKTMEQLIRCRDEFVRQHEGHDAILKLRTQDQFFFRYYVTDTGTEARVPRRFHVVLVWLFAVLGLSVPYRLFLYCSIGHVSYAVDKKVYAAEKNDDDDDDDEL